MSEDSTLNNDLDIRRQCTEQWSRYNKPELQQGLLYYRRYSGSQGKQMFIIRTKEIMKLCEQILMLSGILSMKCTTWNKV